MCWGECDPGRACACLPPDEPAAAADFNPYHRWLGIPRCGAASGSLPLAGHPRFESDPEVIRDAATRRDVPCAQVRPGAAFRAIAEYPQPVGDGESVSVGSAEESGLRCRVSEEADCGGAGSTDATGAACSRPGISGLGHGPRPGRRGIPCSRATASRFVAPTPAHGTGGFSR